MDEGVPRVPGGWRPAILVSVLQCTGQALTAKSHLVQNDGLLGWRIPSGLCIISLRNIISQ